MFKSIVPVCVSVTTTVAAALAPQLALADKGDWHRLAKADFTVAGPNGLEAFEKALDDLPAILTAYKPKKADVTDRKYEAQGPHGLPRISFKAEVEIDYLPDPTMSVKADVKRERIKCNNPFNNTGFRLALDLRDSEEDVRANASRFLIDACYYQNNDGSITVQSQGWMEEGYDFGRFAGPAARRFLNNQTKPMIEAVQRVAQKYRKFTMPGTPYIPPSAQQGTQQGAK